MEIGGNQNENEENVLRPTVVSFRDNSILDLSLPGNEDIQIVDVMKTMDNRYVIDNDLLISYHGKPVHMGEKLTHKNF